MQVIGARDQAEKDEIVKSVMDLQNAEIDEGYTRDAVVSRQVRVQKFSGKSALSAECIIWMYGRLFVVISFLA